MLDALADPTRRAIVESLREGPRAVVEIAERVPVSRPAVSQHLKVLLDAGVVRVSREGTRRLYAVDPQGLGPLRAYVERLWSDVMEAFRRAVEEEPPSVRSGSRGTRGKEGGP